MKKAIQINLAIAFAGFIAAVLLFPQIKRSVDRAILLEERRPGYARYLMKAKTELFEDDMDVYQLTRVNKDGFGDVTPGDIQLYLRNTRRMIPEASHTTLCFQDGTGLALGLQNAGYALYGTIDETGTVTEEAKIIDISEPLIQQIDGITAFQREYDAAGNVTYQFRVDADGNGVADTNGVAGFYRTYDKGRHIIMERKIDVEQKAITNAQGYAEIRKTYDGTNVTWEAYFDEAEKPVSRVDVCYASKRMGYDRKHNCIYEEYFDTSDAATRSSAGYASVKRVYDEKRIIQEAYFAEDGRPIKIPAGYASKNCIYNDQGKLIEESYKGVADEPTLCVNGYARVEYEYDDAGNVVKEKYLDSDNAPIVTPKGYAEVLRVYDGEKRLIRESYYTSAGKPLAQPAGYSEIVQEWERGQLSSRTYLDAYSKPINRTDGYAKAMWIQDEKGVWNVCFADIAGNVVSSEGLNLAMDIKCGMDGWSEWMIPNPNTVNYCFNIGYVNLGQKSTGDVYTAQMEIEFEDVSATSNQAFRFWTQGAQDGKWTTGNVWNGNLINLTEVPENGVYSCTSAVEVSEDMAGISTFNIGFRCDYWASGAFRVRGVTVKKGSDASVWTPGV